MKPHSLITVKLYRAMSHVTDNSDARLKRKIYNNLYLKQLH